MNVLSLCVKLTILLTMLSMWSPFCFVVICKEHCLCLCSCSVTPSLLQCADRGVLGHGRPIAAIPPPVYTLVTAWLHLGYRLVTPWLQAVTPWLQAGCTLVTDWYLGYRLVTHWLQAGCTLGPLPRFNRRASRGHYWVLVVIVKSVDTHLATVPDISFPPVSIGGHQYVA
jgi:hypothetical protein